MVNRFRNNAELSIEGCGEKSSALNISTEPPYFVGRAVGFSGWVDDFERNISAMQFSLDGGAHWTEYATPGVSSERGVCWKFAYTPQRPGRYLLTVRAVDGEGAVSTLVSGHAFEVLEEGAHTPSRTAAVCNMDKDEKLPSAKAAFNTGFADASQKQSIPAAVPTNPPLPFGQFHLRPIGEQHWGASRLYRSGELFGITPAEAEFLTRNLGIRTIYDTRNEFETAAHPQPYLMDAKTIALVPSFERRRKDASKRLVAGVIGKYGEPEQRMRTNYRRYAHEYPLIGKALRSMAAEGAPALVHCVNGKDRTGVLCATLLRIAGFSDEFIVADYVCQNEINAAQIAEEEAHLSVGMSADEHAILMSFLEARPSYLAAFFDEAESQYGSFQGYIEQGLRLTPEQIEALRNLIG